MVIFSLSSLSGFMVPFFIGTAYIYCLADVFVLGRSSWSVSTEVFFGVFLAQKSNQLLVLLSSKLTPNEHFAVFGGPRFLFQIIPNDHACGR